MDHTVTLYACEYEACKVNEYIFITLVFHFPRIMDSQLATSSVYRPSVLFSALSFHRFLQPSHDNYRILVRCHGSGINFNVECCNLRSLEKMYFGNMTLKLISGTRNCLLVLCSTKINGCCVFFFLQRMKQDTVREMGSSLCSLCGMYLSVSPRMRIHTPVGAGKQTLHFNRNNWM